jgi:hypothetical protein
MDRTRTSIFTLSSGDKFNRFPNHQFGNRRRRIRLIKQPHQFEIVYPGTAAEPPGQIAR